MTDKIAALRKQHEATGGFNNTSVLRINAMKFLPNLLERAQLSHIFFLLCAGHLARRLTWQCGSMLQGEEAQSAQ